MPNVAISRRAELSPWRHMSLGTWRTAYDPSIYGTMRLPMGEALRYIERFREATGRHLTVTHLMAKVVGVVLHQMPQVNAILRWNRIYLRADTAVFFQVAISDAKTGEIDLSGVRIDRPHDKSLLEILDEFEAKAARVRAHEDRELERSRGMLQRIPSWLLPAMLRILSFLSYTLNLDLRWAGVARDPFGGAMVTNIGSLGLEAAYPPLVPFSRVPLLVAMGDVQEVAVVQDGEIGIGKEMNLYATFDHRVIDGAHAAAIVKIVRAWFARPFEHFDALEPEAAVAHAAPAP